MSLTSGEGTPFVMNVEPAGSYNNGGSNNDGWGGNGAWWIILFFIFAWGWGGFGGGYGANGGGINSPAGQGAITRTDLCMSESFQDVKREVANTHDAVNLGFSNLNSTICNAAYENAGLINGLGNTVQQGFNAQAIATLQGQNALQAQIAGCCCDAQQTMGAINYNISTQACDTRNTVQNGFRDVIENQNANANAIISKLNQQELEAKNAQITALNQQLFAAQLAASQAAQTTQIVDTLRPCSKPCYLTCSPYQSYNFNPAAFNNSGCGCGGYGVAA